MLTLIKLLYDFDCEKDPISILQALILMTFWSESDDDQKGAWHWTGLCISLARSIGLNLGQREPGVATTRKFHQCRRIWWSLYTRDRLLALGLRRRTQVRDEDCVGPTLTLDDFPQGSFSASVINLVGDCSGLSDIHYQEQLATLFIKKIELCRSLGHVLSTQYSTSATNCDSTVETPISLIPKLATETDFSRCVEELDIWFDSFPEVSPLHRHPDYERENYDLVLFLHRAVLKMTYLAVCSALYRPRALLSSHCNPMHLKSRASPRTKLQSAATEISIIAQRLDELDLIKFLPTSSVTIVVQAAITHLVDAKWKGERGGVASICRFRQCMNILHRLQDMYPVAESQLMFLTASTERAGIRLNELHPVDNHSMASSKRSEILHSSPSLYRPSADVLGSTSAFFANPDLEQISPSTTPVFAICGDGNEASVTGGYSGTFNGAIGSSRASMENEFETLIDFDATIREPEYYLADGDPAPTGSALNTMDSTMGVSYGVTSPGAEWRQIFSTIGLNTYCDADLEVVAPLETGPEGSMRPVATKLTGDLETDLGLNV
jgi:hypothetical protein